MATIDFLIKVLRLIDHEGFNILRTFKSGYSISSYRILEGIGLHCKNIETIIDVGANQGQFALASSRKYPNANIISFEPLPELFEVFKRNLKNKEKVKIHNIALGNERGVIDFYRNEHSHASSALPISEKQKEELPITANTTRTEVHVDRLDNILKVAELSGSTLLKLDVQGYEKNVLLGASNLLPKIDYLVFEASFVSMYEGEPLFDEMHVFLKEMDFELVAPVGFLEGKNGAILQMDFLYGNKGK